LEQVILGHKVALAGAHKTGAHTHVHARRNIKCGHWLHLHITYTTGISMQGLALAPSLCFPKRGKVCLRKEFNFQLWLWLWPGGVRCPVPARCLVSEKSSCRVNFVLPVGHWSNKRTTTRRHVCDTCGAASHRDYAAAERTLNYVIQHVARGLRGKWWGTGSEMGNRQRGMRKEQHATCNMQHTTADRTCTHKAHGACTLYTLGNYDTRP